MNDINSSKLQTTTETPIVAIPCCTQAVKSCNKCNKLLPHSDFQIIKNGTRNGEQIYRLSAWCISCNEENKMWKVCNICNKKLPKTKDFFPQRLIKQENADGLAEYKSFKHACHECYNNYIATFKREQYKNSEVKAKENERNKVWREKNPNTAKELTAKWRQKNRKKLLEKDRKRVHELEDSWVASQVGLPVKECPKEILELTKLIIKLKREFKKY
jgi:hypothetical protein